MEDLLERLYTRPGKALWGDTQQSEGANQQRVKNRGPSNLDAQVRIELGVAIARIDDFQQRTSRMLELAKHTDQFPPADLIQAHELRELDKSLEDLAMRLWNGKVPSQTWSPPGGSAFIQSAQPKDKFDWLRALHGQLRSSRAFFVSFLNATASPPAAVQTSGPNPSPATEDESVADRWKRRLANYKPIAIGIVAVAVVSGLAAFTDALQKLWAFWAPVFMTAFGIAGPVSLSEMTPEELAVCNEWIARVDSHATKAEATARSAELREMLKQANEKAWTNGVLVVRDIEQAGRFLVVTDAWQGVGTDDLVKADLRRLRVPSPTVSTVSGMLGAGLSMRYRLSEFEKLYGQLDPKKVQCTFTE